MALWGDFCGDGSGIPVFFLESYRSAPAHPKKIVNFEGLKNTLSIIFGGAGPNPGSGSSTQEFVINGISPVI
jgi:hypothetical protein